MYKLLKHTLGAMLAAGILSGGLAMADDINKNTELTRILDRLSQQDTPAMVTSLDERMQSLVTIATLSALGDEALLSRAVEKAVTKHGVAPVEIRETMYQGMAYVGMSYIDRAEKTLMNTLVKLNLPSDMEDAGTVTDESRFADGLAIQKGLFGEGIDIMHQNARDDEKAIIIDLLTGWCFGDTYTRKVLPLKEREFLTFVYIAALGGCEPQVRAHAAGNITVGNTRQMLIDALTVMVPYIGYPKTLNAHAMVNEAAGG